MGLDVYLQHCENLEGAKCVEDLVDKEADALWAKAGGYGNVPEGQAAELQNKVRKLYSDHDCGEYGEHNSVTKIRCDSKLHPEHLFKVGYFRSSYNGTGIERVLGDAGVPGLYEIFEPNDRYEFVPNWSRAWDVVAAAIEKYRNHLNGAIGRLSVSAIEANMFSDKSELPKSNADVLAIMDKELSQRSPLFECGYSNARGHFYLKDGLTVKALIPGIGWRGAPCLYVVTEEAEGEVMWYMEALEIVKETIEFVLSQPNPDEFYLRWSS